MKKIIWILVAFVVGGYFVNSYLETKAKREAEEAKAKRIELSIKSSVAQMVSRTGAIVDWEQRLCKGEGFQLGGFLTIELERLWLQNHPILFKGTVKDITTHDQTQYKVLVEKRGFGSFKCLFGPELQLSLLSRKEQIDSFLQKHPGLFHDPGFNNSVVVVAHINAIRTTDVHGAEGEREEIKIGDGELVDIIFTGDVTF